MTIRNATTSRSASGRWRHRRRGALVALAFAVVTVVIASCGPPPGHAMVVTKNFSAGDLHLFIYTDGAFRYTTPVPRADGNIWTPLPGTYTIGLADRPQPQGAQTVYFHCDKGIRLGKFWQLTLRAGDVVNCGYGPSGK